MTVGGATCETSGNAARKRSSSSRTRQQVTPRAAGSGPEQDPVDHLAMIVLTVPPPRMRGHQRRQQLPFLIAQVMTVSSSYTRNDLHQPELKIHATRPSMLLLRGMPDP
jgi:hypothetical protein